MSKRAFAEQVMSAPVLAQILRRLALGDGLLVLNYHRIAADRNADPYSSGVLGPTQERLDRQLTFLRQHADVIRVDDLPEALRARGRHVLVTFDDGYRDNYELAYPVLRTHGLQATFFLPSSYLDEPRLTWWDEIEWMVAASEVAELPAGRWRPEPLVLGDGAVAVHSLTNTYKEIPGAEADDFLDWCGDALGTGRAELEAGRGSFMGWDEAREMRDGGMAFGGHTHSHPILSRLSDDEQEAELRAGRDRFEAEMGEPMRLFSYPVGRRDSFNEASKRMLRSLGVEFAFSCYGGYQRRDRFDPYDLRRASVGAAHDEATLNAMLVAPSAFARW